jgi:hypothetical protein
MSVHAARAGNLRTPRASSLQPLMLDRVRRRDRLGGLLHEYELAASTEPLAMCYK